MKPRGGRNGTAGTVRGTWRSPACPLVVWAEWRGHGRAGPRRGSAWSATSPAMPTRPTTSGRVRPRRFPGRMGSSAGPLAAWPRWGCPAGCRSAAEWRCGLSLGVWAGQTVPRPARWRQSAPPAQPPLVVWGVCTVPKSPGTGRGPKRPATRRQFRKPACDHRSGATGRSGVAVHPAGTSCNRSNAGPGRRSTTGSLVV